MQLHDLSNKKIRVKKVLDRAVKDKLGDMGFVHTKVGDSAKWHYGRDNGKFMEYVIFDKMRGFDEMRAFAGVFPDDMMSWYQLDYLGGKVANYFGYEDEESLYELAIWFLDVFVEKALDQLWIIAIPDLRAPEELELRLFEERSELARAFLEEYALDINKPSFMANLEELILARRGDGMETDWDFLLGAAAALGERLCLVYNAGWLIEGAVFQWCLIANDEGRISIPLMEVGCCWRNPDRPGYKLTDLSTRLKSGPYIKEARTRE